MSLKAAIKPITENDFSPYITSEMIGISELKMLKNM